MGERSYLTVAITLKAVEVPPRQACDKCETLEDRMAQGPLSLDDALGIDQVLPTQPLN
jgi:hypothetical protein